MADSYWRYGASADRASIPRPGLPGYLSEASALQSRTPWASSHDLLSNTSDFLHRDSLVSRPGEYVPGSYSGYNSGATLNGYSSALVDSYLPARRDSTPGIPNHMLNGDGLADGESMQSNVLFVDGLPNDCSRREVSHLFRPFFGFKEIRVVHKEPRHEEDKAMVLCFVEFADAKCALTALEALQGYKFDNKKPDSPALRIHFAHFPFQLPSNKEHFWLILLVLLLSGLLMFSFVLMGLMGTSINLVVWEVSVLVLYKAMASHLSAGDLP